MKTLNEVIKDLEKCITDDAIESEGVYLATDALHYLKEYQDRKETLRNWTEKAISEQQNLSDAITFLRAYRDDKDDLTALRVYWAEQQANPALTWDELKQMEGKPIWTEDIIHEKGEWLLVHIVVDNDIWYVDKWADKERLNRDGYGRLWQAYRKERE